MAEGDLPAPAPAPAADAAALEALSEAVASHEEQLSGLWGRAERIDRQLGLRAP